MILAKVYKTVVSTKKNEKLVGSTFMVCQALDAGERNAEIVAIDSVGAGIGDTVLITTGSSARYAFHREDGPVDAVIVGIVD